MARKFNANSPAKTKSYLINNSTKKKLTFQFSPESVPYGRSARYATIDSPGMSYARTDYTGSGGPMEFPISIFYYDRPYTGKINTARKFLMNLVPPLVNKASYKKPPSATFACGYIVYDVVVLSVDVSDELFNNDGNPTMTTFTVNVRVI